MSNMRVADIYLAIHRAEVLYVKIHGKIPSTRTTEVFYADVYVEFRDDDILFIQSVCDWIIGCREILDINKKDNEIPRDAENTDVKRLSSKQILITNLYSHMCLWTYLEKNQIKHNIFGIML